MSQYDPVEGDAINNLDLMVQVAEKYYIEQLTQSQIAELFGISRSTISRLLSRAREDGIVRIHIVRPQIRRRDTEKALCHRYGLDEAIVIGLHQWPLEGDALRHLVGSEAAQFVDPMIQPNMVVGVGRGRTLAELARALRRLATPRNITIVQILGDIDIRHSPTRATEITRLLSESYVGTSYYLNAPALVSDAQLAHALMQSPNMAQLSRLYDELDLAIVGIGALHDSPLVLSGQLKDEDIRQLAAAGAVGDVGGHFFTIHGEPIDHAYSGTAIGISWQQLLDCPRLIAIASGPEKVNTLLGLLRIQMLNVLVTDEGTAKAILAT
ncbi:MAG: sugar-binding transcriptional regulator [Caldilineaceae bacterium]|nr:sugar-binding transcriptional regulator [Caldilineaceae bacterium]